MKFILMLVLSLAVACTATAKCSLNGLRVFPSGEFLRQNPVIVIDGYSGSREVIHGLGTKYLAYLQSGQEKIKLSIRETLDGQFKLSQAILVAEKTLTAGKKYRLFIDNLPDYEQLDKWNPVTNKRESIIFTVLEGLDTVAPVLEAVPSEIEKTFIEYGDGPEIYVNFTCPVRDSSVYLVRASIKNITTGEVAAFYVEPKNGQIKIGHGMCSGAFEFNEASRYEMTLTVMDASGNYSAFIAKGIPLSCPTSANALNKNNEGQKKF